jgi:hypothetical protein
VHVLDDAVVIEGKHDEQSSDGKHHIVKQFHRRLGCRTYILDIYAYRCPCYLLSLKILSRRAERHYYGPLLKYCSFCKMCITLALAFLNNSTGCALNEYYSGKLNFSVIL